MLRHHWRYTMVAVLALCVLGCGTASAQEAVTDPAEQAALNELTELLKIKERPKTQAETMALLTEMVTKAEGFAEKHKSDRAGAMALLLVAQISGLRLGKHDTTVRATKTFLERYPKDSDAPVAKFLLGSALFNKREHKAAKEVLTALISDHPEFGGKAQAQALLKKIELFDRPAPDFTTQDFAGNEVKLSGFKGKIVLLDFYAGWCGPCKAEMPNLKRLYAKYKDQGLEIVGISLDASLEKAKSYAKGEGITWTATWKAPGGWKTPIVGLYGVRGIPAMFLVGKDGKIMKTGLRGPALAKALADIFGAAKDAPKEPAG